MPKAYRRVNLDGNSVTETREMDAALNPGTFVVINNDNEFAKAAVISGRMYLLHPANHQGLEITDAVPAGDSGIAEYVEEGRELAVRVGPGTYKKDQAITMSNAGLAIAIPVAAGTYKVIGYSQDDLTVASGQYDFIRVRFGRAHTVIVS